MAPLIFDAMLSFVATPCFADAAMIDAMPSRLMPLHSYTLLRLRLMARERDALIVAADMAVAAATLLPLLPLRC